jgi:adenylate cyclase class IV
VCLDKNAGYGYLAEFETVTEDKESVANVKKELEEFMKEVECVELQQDRLARMFDFYNQNWADYYGTDKIFNIE